jgi:hypothetical protein
LGARREIGEGLRESLAARGRAISSADARRLSLALLSLAEAGLLEPVPESEDERPHVYNMGPLKYEKGNGA